MRNRERTWCALVCYTLVLLATLLAACSKNEELCLPHSSRVVLVYMAGDNSLGGYVRDNLDAMARGMAFAPAGSRTIAYVDTPGENPRLVEVTASGTETLHVWPGAHNSASAATVREAIGRVRTLAPANRYGLVLWSHGLAWMPSWATGYLTRSKARMAEPWPQTKHDRAVSETSASFLPAAFSAAAPWPATKWFGQDTGESPAGYLDVEQLSEAIPSGVFDWILFDACFMASAETLYALRDKAERIVCSPAEVIADGFPYEKIMAELLRPEPDLRAVCESYYLHYARHAQSSYRSATVSLVETSQLEALAAATASVLGAALTTDPEALAGMELSRVQPLDRYRRHFLFDMGSVVGELETRGLVPASLAGAWRAQLARTVIYEAHTPTMLGLPLDACCGLSMYVPVASYADLNEYYRTLEWYVRCFPADYSICDK
ncbi:clostripain-related cysteine peptidase [Alistipes timonensis]